MLNKELLKSKILEKNENISNEEIEIVLPIIFEKISHHLIRDEEVRISDFGKFAIVDRKAKKAINPSTGEEIFVPESRAVKFKLAKVTKEKLNEK